MSFIDIFIKREEELAQEQPAKQEAAPAQQNTTVQPTANVNNTFPVGDTAELITENKKMLWQTLSDRNLPGPDMLELLNTASSLHGMGMSKDKEFEAAYRMLRTQYPTFTKENLLESVETYIGFIHEELEDGTKQFQERREKVIGSKEGDIANLQKTNLNIEAKITELKKKLEENTATIAALQAEVTAENAKLEYSEGMFKQSVNAVIDELNENKKIMATLNI